MEKDSSRGREEGGLQDQGVEIGCEKLEGYLDALLMECWWLLCRRAKKQFGCESVVRCRCS